MSSGAVANSKFRQKIEKVASLNIVHQHVDKMAVFVGLVQLDNKRTVDNLKDLLLALNELLHLVLDNDVFLDTF